jgi:hypothetical protein
LQQGFVRDIVTRLESLGTTYAITGSMASSFWGIPRLTHDVDILVVFAPTQVPQILNAFSDPYYVSEKAVKEALSSGSMFNVIDPSTSLKADMWVFKDDAFNRSLLDRRQRVELLPKLPAYVASAEDVLLHKLIWYKITPSDRQISDASGIAVICKETLNLNYLRGWAARQTTSQLLEEVLQGKGLKST